MHLRGIGIHKKAIASEQEAVARAIKATMAVVEAWATIWEELTLMLAPEATAWEVALVEATAASMGLHIQV